MRRAGLSASAELYLVIIVRQHALCRSRHYYVISVSSVETVAHTIQPLSASGSGIIPVSESIVTEFQEELFSAGIKHTAGSEKYAIFGRNRRLSQKRYEIGPRLLRITKRKS